MYASNIDELVAGSLFVEYSSLDGRGLTPIPRLEGDVCMLEGYIR